MAGYMAWYSINVYSLSYGYFKAQIIYVEDLHRKGLRCFAFHIQVS